MSSSHIAPHMEVHISKCPPDSLNLTAVDACNNQIPCTEAHRSQQFLDIADDLEGPPPYQDDVADSYIVVRDIHHMLSFDTTKMLALCDRFSPAKLNQYIDARDFILFQDEILWADDGDISSSDTFSSQVSCCSDVSMETSTESSTPLSTSALEGQQRSTVVELAHSNIEKHPELTKSVDSGRIVDWLLNIVPSPQEVEPCFSTTSGHSIISASQSAENSPDFQQNGCPFHC